MHILIEDALWLSLERTAFKAGAGADKSSEDAIMFGTIRLLSVVGPRAVAVLEAWLGEVAR